MEKPTPFSQAALHALALHNKHREIMTEINGNRNTRRTDLELLEQEFEETLDRVRVAYTAASGLEVSRFYTTRVHAAMRYFGMDSDPLYRQMSQQLGRLQMSDGSGRLRPRSTFLKGYEPASTLHGNKLASQQGVVRSPKLTMREVHTEDKISEQPAPPREYLAAQNDRSDVVKIPERHYGHWVLRDAGIAISKAGRKEDPW